MGEHYDDAMLEVGSQTLYLIDYGRWTSGPDPLGTPWGTSREQRWRDTYTADARTLLAAVAPLIAAKALRDAATYWGENPDAVDDETPADARNWLRDRADEIERGRS